MSDTPPDLRGQRSRLLQPIFLAYVLVILLIGYRSWSAPTWSWDLLAYVGSVAESQGQSPEEIHQRAYGELARVAPAEVVQDLRGGEVTDKGQHEYRERLATDPAAFQAQLNFYRGRLLFIRLLALLEQLGLPSIRGAFLVSALSGVVFAMLLTIWLNRYLSPSLAVLGSVAVLQVTGTIGVASMGAPDMLAATLLLAGAFTLLETPRRWLALLLMLAALATRADHLLLIAPVLACAVLTPRDAALKLGLGPAGLALVLCLAMVGWCTAGQHTYSWWTVFHHTFVGYMAFPAEQTPAPDYAQAIGRSLRSLPMFKALQPLIFSSIAGVAVLWGWRKSGMRSFGASLAACALLGAVAHFALFPALWPRLMLAYWVLGVVGFGAVWNEHRAPSNLN